MALRDTIGAAFTWALIMAPPIGLAVSLAFEDVTLLGDEETLSIALLILTMSYTLTFLGLMVVALPLTAILERFGGGVVVGAVNGMITLLAFAFAVSTRDGFGRQAWLTLGFSAGIFTFIYLRRGSASQAAFQQSKDA